MDPAKVDEVFSQVVFSGDDFKATFDKQSGLLTSYIYKKQEYIHNGQGPHLSSGVHLPIMITEQNFPPA
jgi:beta-galactosidase